MLALSAFVALSLSGPLPFDFRDPKAISAVSLTLDSAIEPIVGYAKGISGTLLFDPAHPERASGRVAVDVSSVQFANDGYTATARGYALNEKKWPQLFLALRRVESVKKVSKTRYAGTVLADFTCRGITVPKRLAVTADYFPGRAEERTNGEHKGDLLVLRTRFSVSRRAHGISEGIPDSMVGDSVEVGVAVVGIHYAATTPKARWEAELADRDDPTWLRIEHRESRQSLQSATGNAPTLPRLGGGKRLSLAEAQGKGRLVLLFLNEQCGVTVYYKERLRKLIRDFNAKGFRFVAIRTGRSVGPKAPQDLPERGYLPVPFLEDEEGNLMRKYGIGQSLTFVVLDTKGAIRYQGGFDDNVIVAKVRRTPLRDALRAIAAGRPVPISRAPSMGCAILPVER